MKTLLSFPLLVVFGILLGFSGTDSANYAAHEIGKSETIHNSNVDNDEIQLSMHQDYNPCIQNLENVDSESEDFELLTNDCEGCQECGTVGGYSQISASGPSIIFYAYTFIQGGNPICGCFTDISGTITFEYEIRNGGSGGQLITQGSYTENLINGQSSSHCGFGYSGGGALTNQHNYPHPGGSVWVYLKTIHVAGSSPFQTYTHETWTL